MTDRDYCGSDLDPEDSEDLYCASCGIEFTSYNDDEDCDACLGRAYCQKVGCDSGEAKTRYADEYDGSKDFVGIYCAPHWATMLKDDE